MKNPQTFNHLIKLKIAKSWDTINKCTLSIFNLLILGLSYCYFFNGFLFLVLLCSECWDNSGVGGVKYSDWGIRSEKYKRGSLVSYA